MRLQGLYSYRRVQRAVLYLVSLPDCSANCVGCSRLPRFQPRCVILQLISLSRTDIAIASYPPRTADHLQASHSLCWMNTNAPFLLATTMSGLASAFTSAATTCVPTPESSSIK